MPQQFNTLFLIRKQHKIKQVWSHTWGSKQFGVFTVSKRIFMCRRLGRCLVLPNSIASVLAVLVVRVPTILEDR
jgi:hypothetical protein